MQVEDIKNPKSSYVISESSYDLQNIYGSEVKVAV